MHFPLNFNSTSFYFEGKVYISLRILWEKSIASQQVCTNFDQTTLTLSKVHYRDNDYDDKRWNIFPPGGERPRKYSSCIPSASRNFSPSAEREAPFPRNRYFRFKESACILSRFRLSCVWKTCGFTVQIWVWWEYFGYPSMQST